MIITVAGTSGSGKSHLMRSFLKWAVESNGAILFKEYIEGREAPIGYRLDLGKKPGPKCNVSVLGHYDSPTGGCDTIHNIEQVFELVKSTSAQGTHVLYEGLFVMNMTRGPRLVQELGVPFYVLQLTTPLAKCISSINERRAERGEGELDAKKNTIQNYKRAENYSYRMRDAGARVVRTSRGEALDRLIDLLGV